MANRTEYQRRWYLANRENHLARSRERLAIKRGEIRAYIAAELAGRSCVDCGENDPVVLDFDHLGAKSFNISEAVNRLTTIPALEAEIRKCVVRCANCHRRKTHRALGYRSKADSTEGESATSEAGDAR